MAAIYRLWTGFSTISKIGNENDFAVVLGSFGHLVSRSCFTQRKTLDFGTREGGIGEGGPDVSAEVAGDISLRFG